jgi:hypothetical protein
VRKNTCIKYIKGFKIGWGVYGFGIILIGKVTSLKKLENFFENERKKVTNKKKKGALISFN